MKPDRLDASIVFATRDRSPQLRRTLDAYRELDTEGISWELIVIDNNSQDDTNDVLESAAASLPLTHLFVSEPGQNRARNIALEKLCSDLVVFTDDDALPDPGCLSAYIGAAQRWPDEAIFGARIDPDFPPDTPEWLKDPGFKYASTMFGHYAPSATEGPVKRHPYGPSFAVRRSALAGHRFDEHLGPQPGAYAMGGEGDFLRRLAGDRYQFIHVPDARVRHVVRPNQVTPEWLFARARKKGHGQQYMPSSRKKTRIHIRGIPLKWLTALLRSWLRYQLSYVAGKRRRYIHERIQFELRYGQILELHQQRR